MVGCDLGEHFGQGRAVCDIERVCVAADRFGDGAGRSLGKICHDGRRALLMEPAGDLLAEPPRGAGDECDFAREPPLFICHVETLRAGQPIRR